MRLIALQVAGPGLIAAAAGGNKEKVIVARRPLRKEIAAARAQIVQQLTVRQAADLQMFQAFVLTDCDRTDRVRYRGHVERPLDAGVQLWFTTGSGNAP